MRFGFDPRRSSPPLTSAWIQNLTSSHRYEMSSYWRHLVRLRSAQWPEDLVGTCFSNNPASQCSQQDSATATARAGCPPLEALPSKTNYLVKRIYALAADFRSMARCTRLVCTKICACNLDLMPHAHVNARVQKPPLPSASQCHS